ncbi:MAG: thioredoxin domain-containing protein [Patescibacteria group bacterium]
MSEGKSKMFENSNPRLVFVLGIVIGVGIFSLLSLAVLLGFVMNDDSDSEAADDSSNTNKVVANTNTAAASDLTVDMITITEDEAVYGNEDAKITIVEFSDFQCPFCQKHHPTVKNFVDGNDDVKWVFKHFPLNSHPQAKPASIAAECANEQGKFFEYVDALFENQSSLAANYYTELASELGLNTSKFETCLEDEDVAAKVNNDYQMGIAAGVTGTPATIIFNEDGDIEMVSGAVEESYIEDVVNNMK